MKAIRLGSLALCLFASYPVACSSDHGTHGFNTGQVATLELYVDQVGIAPGRTISVLNPSLAPGEEAALATVRVINTGHADLAISEVFVESDPSDVFRLTDPNATSNLSSGPYVIVPQDAEHGQLTLIAKLVVKRPARGVTPTGSIHIRSNTVAGTVPQPELIYPLQLETNPPKLVVVPDKVDFGKIVIGASTQASLTIVNQGGDLLVIDRVELRGHPGFGVALGPNTWTSAPEADPTQLDPPLEIDAGQQASVTAQYAATGPENAAAQLVLFSNDPAAAAGFPVPLTANAGAPTPPVVTIDAPEGASGDVLCKLVTEATDTEPLTYTWHWQIDDGAAFTTFGATLTADAVLDCDRIQCWAEVTDGTTVVSSNVASDIMPFGTDCDDHNVCTDDTCGPTGGCAVANNTKPCTDSDLCNGSEVCSNGICQPGTATECNDVTDPCLAPTCNPATGLCDLPREDGTSCPDADLCNGLETCHAGICQPGSTVDCSGVTNPCLQNTCNPGTGVCDLPKPDNTSCADANLCNGAETCHSGICQPAAAVDCTGVTNPCLQKACNPGTGLCDLPEPENTSCADADLCDGAETCHSGICQSGTAVDCAGVTNPCLQKTCNPTTGLCNLAKPDNSSCADSDLCNGAETCHSGTCQSGVAVDCSGVTNPCLQKSCNPSTGTCDLPVPDETPCPDGNPCNGAESCRSGTCEPGTPTDCSSITYPCLEKTCNPATGACDLPKPNNTPCGPDDACATAKTCQAGICTGGTTVDCSAVTDVCLQKACNPATGTCDLPVADGVLCSTADACTVDDICQAGTCSTGTPIPGTVDCGCVPPSDLMLYYDFDGEIADQSGNGRNATSSAPPAYVSGHRGQAIAFDGTYKLTVGNGNALGPTTSRARTVSFWLDTGPTGTGSVVGQYASGPAADTFEITYTRASGRFEASGTGVDIVQYAAGSTLSDWHHWAITFATGANGVRIYKDGVRVAQGALTLNAAESTRAVTVGGLASTGTPLRAHVDDLRIFGRALTISEIALLAGICSPVQAANCGNGVLDPGETCDDGNTVDDDNCSNTCVPPWPCPSGTMPDGTRFMVCANKTNWANARLECKALGFDDLASVRSASENALLASLSQEAGADVDLFWIGLTDSVSEGHHVWSDGAPNTFTNWDAGEPNDLYLGCPGNEDCVHFYRAAPRTGHWNDAICCSNGVGYACERRP